MGILGEVFDTLSGLLAEGGLEDPTFRRMVEVYREVTQDLNCHSEYERMLAGLMKHAGSAAYGEAGDRLPSQRPVRFSFL
ncbi:MAG: hypothetical protein NVSMB65_13810 [Chloroflexota bacterium]